MKVGDLIIGPNYVSTRLIRVILKIYQFDNGYDVIDMLDCDGKIVRWDADNIHTYWSVINHA